MVEISEIDDQDIDRAYELHNRYFGQSRSPDDWKHLYTGLHPTKYVFSVAKDGDKIVGTQGIIPMNLEIKDGTILSGKSENTLVDKDYRGLILFSKLYKHCLQKAEEKGIQVVWGLTVLGDLWKRALKFDVYPTYGRYFGVISIREALKSLDYFGFRRNSRGFRKFAISIALLPLIIGHGISIAMKKKLFLRKISDMKTSITENLRNPNDILILYGKLRQTYPELIHLQPNQNFLDWRVYKNRNVNYSTKFLYQGDDLLAFCIYSVSNDGKKGYLTSFTFENFEAGKILLKHILNDPQLKNVGYLTFFGNTPNPLIENTMTLLKKIGMRYATTPTFIVIKNLTLTDPAPLTNIANWHLDGLWTEGFDI